jgi:hypothetical protein
VSEESPDQHDLAGPEGEPSSDASREEVRAEPERPSAPDPELELRIQLGREDEDTIYVITDEEGNPAPPDDDD